MITGENPFTVIIKNNTGVGQGTEVYNEKGERIKGINSIQIEEIAQDDVIYANLRFITPRLEVKAHLKTCEVVCSKCSSVVDLGEPVKLLEDNLNKDGLFGVLCEKCFNKRDKKWKCAICGAKNSPRDDNCLYCIS